MSSSSQTITVQTGPVRLDIYLAQNTDYTRSYIKQLSDEGRIFLNGQVIIKSGKMVAANDKIEVFPIAKEIDISPKNIPLNIIYQDDDIAVINKQAGLVVHPGGGVRNNTLVSALLYHLKNLSTINGVLRPGIVHRLDKDTTGLMVIAKNNNAHLSLSSQIENRQVKKIYLAIAEGNIKSDSGQIFASIARSPKDRKKMMVMGGEIDYTGKKKFNLSSPTKRENNAREALTKFKVIKRFSQFSLVGFNIITGRTHQIRVHAKFMKHSILGDRAYGAKLVVPNLDGPLLHAYSLSFTHPASKKLLTFTAPLHKQFKEILGEQGDKTEYEKLLVGLENWD